MQQQIEVGLLLFGEIAGFANGDPVAADVGGNFREGGGSVGEVKLTGSRAATLGYFCAAATMRLPL